MEVEMDLILNQGFNYGYEQYSVCSFTSTIEDEHNNYSKYLNNWSPAINWEPLCGEEEGFHGLIDSMIMCSNTSTAKHNENELYSITHHDQPPPPTFEEEGDNRGLKLVHLLVAAAEALKGTHKSTDLSRVILVRLKELVPPYGCPAGQTNMERLAAHFTDALQSLLDGAGPHHRVDNDVLAAYQLLQDMSPYVKFGHFTVNQAILESVTVSNRVHIVDYDIMEGSQWASLMQAMVSKKNAPSPPHLRITAVTRSNGSGYNIGRKLINSVQETGRRLTAFAASIGLPFSFGQCRLDSDQKFHPNAVKTVKGEVVIANCVLHLPHIPHRSAASVASFLKGAATMGAKLITVVEEECESKRMEDENSFISLFMDELHRYSAIWDSLEAGFPMQGRARGLVEKAILGPRITGAVARAYRQNEEELKGEGSWANWLKSIGFCKIGISSFNHCQARLLLGLFNDGYRVEEGAYNKLILSWKMRRLISASIWSPPLQSPSPSTTTSGYSS